MKSSDLVTIAGVGTVPDVENQLAYSDKEIGLIEARGLTALRDALGRAGMVKFLQQFSAGSGNYTRDRAKFLAGFSMDDLRKRVKRPQKRTSRRK